MAARIHLKHGIDSLALIKSLNLLRILPNLTQNLISGLVLLVSQRKIHALRPPLRDVYKRQGRGCADVGRENRGSAGESGPLL